MGNRFARVGEALSNFIRSSTVEFRSYQPRDGCSAALRSLDDEVVDDVFCYYFVSADGSYV